MPSMTALINPAGAASRPELPRRPIPHERTPDRLTPSGGRPHPRTAHAADPTILEALRQVVEQQIGPREPGAIYQNSDGAFEVLSVTRSPERARGLLNRRCAQWAVIVRDVLRADAQPFAVGSVWTSSDRLVRSATASRARMAGDACGLCGRWSCDPSTCPPSSVVPATAAPTMSGNFQCDMCGGWFGVTGASPQVGVVTAWTCGACQRNQA
ncbi:hypothetical protein OHB41_50750 [Streptomyces sp. NBC_01571]|uniref:hypothetical protein n=1 Tax=Streptomyces sp. NBC_01571 TaxID=2975883 RepID=UPI002250363A|nr:hypothetical protein [Streptomyces sp. NBC_01571]MCX4581240.1 hypothetical protein [Streptomyces sp. NBC_01571]